MKWPYWSKNTWVPSLCCAGIQKTTAAFPKPHSSMCGHCIKYNASTRKAVFQTTQSSKPSILWERHAAAFRFQIDCETCFEMYSIYLKGRLILVQWSGQGVEVLQFCEPVGCERAWASELPLGVKVFEPLKTTTRGSRGTRSQEANVERMSVQQVVYLQVYFKS